MIDRHDKIEINPVIDLRLQCHFTLAWSYTQISLTTSPFPYKSFYLYVYLHKYHSEFLSFFLLTNRFRSIDKRAWRMWNDDATRNNNTTAALALGAAHGFFANDIRSGMELDRLISLSKRELVKALAAFHRGVAICNSWRPVASWPSYYNFALGMFVVVVIFNFFLQRRHARPPTISSLLL